MENRSSRSFSIDTLGPGFGGQLRGIGLRDVVESDAAYRAVRAMFEEYSVLLFRKQDVTDELQLAFSTRFGPLESPTPGTLADNTFFTVLSNIDAESGALVPPDHKESLRAKANQLWHTDSSFKQTPSLCSILSARTIPPSGGETEFASTRLAWDRLPAAVRALDRGEKPRGVPRSPRLGRHADLSLPCAAARHAPAPDRHRPLQI